MTVNDRDGAAGAGNGCPDHSYGGAIPASKKRFDGLVKINEQYTFETFPPSPAGVLLGKWHA